MQQTLTSTTTRLIRVSSDAGVSSVGPHAAASARRRSTSYARLPRGNTRRTRTRRSCLKVRGGDGGAIAHGPVSARVWVYDVLDDTITNITLSITPVLITKLRANATRSRPWRGIEGKVKLPASFSVGFTSGIDHKM
jgi:hypothetical protein